MRTNIVIDDKTIKEASELTGIKTKRKLVHEALLALIQLKKRKSLLELKGKIQFDTGYNYKVLRERKA